MRLPFFLTIAAIVTAAATPGHTEACVSVPANSSLDVRMRVECEPPAGDWTTPAAIRAGEGWQAVTERGFRMTLTPHGAQAWRVNVSRDGGSAFRLLKIEAEVRAPLEGITAVWDTQAPPAQSIFRRTPEIDFSIVTRPNLGIPLLVAVDHYGNNRLAAGWLDQDCVSEVAGRRDGLNYLVTLRVLGDAKVMKTSHAAHIYLDRERSGWFDTVRAYASRAGELSGYEPNPIPDGARKPLYSTRYPFSDAIDEKTVTQNAALAAEMGVRQFVIDVGWSTTRSWADKSGDYGDYTGAPGKFPNLRQTIDELKKKHGMRVILWAAPTWIGEGSRAFDKVRDYRVKWPGGDYDRNLCPRSPEAREFIAGSLERAIRDYGADGLWMDFVDTFYDTCDAPHTHDVPEFHRGLELLEAEIWKRVRRANPEATVEYRIPFANIFTKQHANVYETTYSPDDFHANRLLGVSLRAYSDGVLTKSDPVYWLGDAHHEQVGRHMMTSIFLGPPAISGDLRKMSKERREQIAGWLKYYNDNRDDLAGGDFAPFGESFHNPDLRIVGKNRAFVYLATKQSRTIEIPKQLSELHIHNSNPPENGQLRLEVHGLADGAYKGIYYSCFMKTDRQEDFVCKDGRMVVNTDMPTGGVLVLRKQ